MKTRNEKKPSEQDLIAKWLCPQKDNNRFTHKDTHTFLTLRICVYTSV